MRNSYLGILCLICLFISSCNEKAVYVDVRGSDYAGAQSCIQCHPGIAREHMKSPHYLATAPAIRPYVLGKFSKADHVFKFDEDTKVVMEKRKDSFYQVLYENNQEVKAFNMSVVFGNKNAQTSVYWKNHNPYELPISYYTHINDWGTSPGDGFPSDKPNFDRRVLRECFACHSSNANSLVITGNSEDLNFLNTGFEDVIKKETIIYGIDCERCHGPAKEHVNYHLKYPNSDSIKYIQEFKNLSHQQRLDACVICHSGKGMKIKSRFGFKPGDKLSDFHRPTASLTDTETDVHGNQYQLLLESKCFLTSKTMDCTTCHNPHDQSEKSPTYYAGICLSCHKGIEHETKKIKQLSKVELSANCIHCHMPKKSSKAIQFHREQDSSFSSYSLRTHRIAIY